MKHSEVKVFGRAAMVGRQLSGAMIPLAFCVAVLLWGFMTANIRLLLSADIIEQAVSAWGELFVPLMNITACLVLVFVGAFVFFPATVGIHEWFMNGALNRGRSLKTVFGWYAPQKAVRAFFVSTVIFAIKAAIYILFSLPGLALAAGGVYMLFSSGVSMSIAVVIFTGSAVLLLLGAGFAFCAVQRYAAATYIVALRPKTKARSAISASAKIMQGRYISCAAFKLSFLPWLLSCVLIVPTLFVWPYYKQACAIWVLETVRDVKTRNG